MTTCPLISSRTGSRWCRFEPLGFGRSDRPVSYPAGGLHEQILAVCDVEGITDFAVWGYCRRAGRWRARLLRRRLAPKSWFAGASTSYEGLSDGWLARMNQERRIPVASRTFWNWFHAYDWYVELRRLRTPMLTYFGSLDRQRVSVQGSEHTEGLGDRRRGICRARSRSLWSW